MEAVSTDGEGVHRDDGECTVLVDLEWAARPSTQ